MYISSVFTAFMIVLCLTVNNCYSRALASNCSANTYSDNSFTQAADKFSIYDEVFLRVQCEALPIGEHIISTQWMDEKGRLQSERIHTVEIGFPRGHSASFRFKQMPQGSIKRMASGEDFENFQYGQWSVLTFVNNEEISRIFFTIRD